jgi:glycosyltransferase involved in cell wall biosynthesis
MRIALITVYPNDGGSTRVLRAAADALAGHHEIVVHAPRPDASDPMATAFPATPLTGPMRKLRALPRLLTLAVQGWRWLGQRRPDLVYVHDEPTLYSFGLAARARGIPVLWHVHMRAGAGLAGMLRHRIASARIVIADAGEGPAPIPSRTVPNPVRRLAVARRPAAEHLTLVSAGTIQPRKNQAAAIRTLRALRGAGRQARLLIYGETVDQPYRAALDRQIAAAGLEAHVRFMGHAAAADLMTEADVMLFPSTIENQPLGLIEALIAGVPVIASDIPAHRALAALEPALHAMLAPVDSFSGRIIADGGLVADGPTRDRLAGHFSEAAFAAAIRAAIDGFFGPATGPHADRHGPT